MGGKLDLRELNLRTKKKKKRTWFDQKGIIHISPANIIDVNVEMYDVRHGLAEKRKNVKY
uniref:Uncharacterized protein n=1 Tax=Romanomermis culicivorax TaxID=13658 RepID=A0A915JFZ8_ROMCU